MSGKSRSGNRESGDPRKRATRARGAKSVRTNAQELRSAVEAVSATRAWFRALRAPDALLVELEEWNFQIWRAARHLVNDGDWETADVFIRGEMSLVDALRAAGKLSRD